MSREIKTILITGGAGFIGSHLAKLLIKRDHLVICLDNLHTGELKNLSRIESHPQFQFINQDIQKELNMEVDEIYNLASPASPIHYQKHPVETIRTNVLGAINTLDLARKNHCKILHASTSEVYGDPLEHPQKENYWGNVNPVGRRSCYDEGKRCGETLFMDYHRQFDVDIRIARIFNTYGPNMQPDDGRVVSNFIMQALKGENITIYGDGTQTRSFCFVEDMVWGLMSLMESDDLHTPVNLGNPNEISILDLAHKVIQLTNSHSKIEFKDLPHDDPVRRKPDISLAKTILNWSPTTNLDNGLLKTIEYFKNYVSH